MAFAVPARSQVEVPGASAAQAVAAKRLLDRLMRIPGLAHHPTCRYWDNHLIRIGTASLCLGCTALGIGLVAGVMALVASRGHWPSQPLLFGSGVLLFLPTLVQVKWQAYAFKLVARSLLGFAVSLLLACALFMDSWTTFPGLGMHALLLGTFLAVGWWTLKLRSRHLDVPCDRCPEGRLPFCAWRREELREALARDDATRELPPALRSFMQFALRELDAGRAPHQAQPPR